ncbi:MAG: NAD(+) synthase, partial [Bacillota bacterium]
VGDDAIAVLLPCDGTSCKDEEYAQLVADTFDLDTISIDLKEPFEAMAESFQRQDIPEKTRDRWPRTAVAISEPDKDYAMENAKPRVRMIALYYVAERMNYAVVGTSNKSEVMAGYYTNHGDNAADIQPLIDLLKTEVWDLAVELGVPEEIIERPPSAGFHEGQTDEDELGVSYRTFDRILSGEMPTDESSDVPDEEIRRAKELKTAAAEKSKARIFRNA